MVTESGVVPALLGWPIWDLSLETLAPELLKLLMAPRKQREAAEAELGPCGWQDLSELGGHSPQGGVENGTASVAFLFCLLGPLLNLSVFSASPVRFLF